MSLLVNVALSHQQAAIKHTVQLRGEELPQAIPACKLQLQCNLTHLLLLGLGSRLHACIQVAQLQMLHPVQPQLLPHFLCPVCIRPLGCSCWCCCRCSWCSSYCRTAGQGPGRRQFGCSRCVGPWCPAPLLCACRCCSGGPTVAAAPVAHTWRAWQLRRCLHGVTNCGLPNPTACAACHSRAQAAAHRCGPAMRATCCSCILPRRFALQHSTQLELGNSSLGCACS